MSAIEADWAEAERLWRCSARMDERLDMVERALAAIGRRQDDDIYSGTPGRDRDPGRTK
ncbi:MAG: hypothetical protein QOD42_104 [Sphingomonadales bacterium]|jgi:hypothetical protein|nr:hypothetical protein [Sphingomonadales bacterium]